MIWNCDLNFQNETLNLQRIFTFKKNHIYSTMILRNIWCIGITINIFHKKIVRKLFIWKIYFEKAKAIDLLYLVWTHGSSWKLCERLTCSLFDKNG
jgi:hypothetical protein